MNQQREYRLQSACVKWFRLQHGKLLWNLFAIPNSNELSFLNRRKAAIQMTKLKKAGLLSGAADLFLAIPYKDSHGLFIEMKIKPNKPSDNQIEFGLAVRKAGYDYVICYNFDQFRELITDWINGTYTRKEIPLIRKKKGLFKDGK